MILITAPVFGDLTSLNEQLPEVVRMAMGATVSRIRIELIFRRCWNLITPCGQHSTAGETARAPCAGAERPATAPREPNPHQRGFLDSGKGHTGSAVRFKGHVDPYSSNEKGDCRIPDHDRGEISPAPAQLPHPMRHFHRRTQVWTQTQHNGTELDGLDHV